MSDPSDIIHKLEQQIAFLNAELARARQRSDSLWYSIHSAFIQEGNEEESAAFWADKLSEILASWANQQRNTLTQRVISSGEMPPYTDCLKDLVMSLSPPGSEPPELDPSFAELAKVPVVGPQMSPPPPTRGLSDDTQFGPPRERVVGVPKAIPGATPTSLLPAPTSEGA